MPRTIPSLLTTVIESSQNKPVELIEVFLDSGTLRFAQHDADITYNGFTWTAMGWKRSPISTTVTEQVDLLTVGLDNVDKVLAVSIAAEEWRGKRARIVRVFREDLTAGNEITIFDGLMDQPSIAEQTFSLRIRSRLDLVNKTYPARVYSTQCNYKHYDKWCTVNREAAANKVTGTCSAGCTTTKIISTAFTHANNYWKLGHIKFTSGGQNRIGRIVQSSDQTGTFIVLRIPLDAAPASGDSFEIIRGCDRTPNDCITKYSNYVNFGGFDHIPKPVIPLASFPTGGGGKGGGKGGGGK